MKKNLIVTDFKIEYPWPFLNCLSKYDKFNVFSFVANGTQKNIYSNIKRKLKYLFVSFNLFLHRKRFSYVITWQQFFGLGFSFLLSFIAKKAQKLSYLPLFIKKKKD